MNNGVKTVALPQLMRLAMIAAITLTSLEVCQSASELAVVLNADEIELAGDVPLPDFYAEADKLAFRQAFEASFNSKKTTLKTMNVSRSLILMGLIGSAAMAFLAALRIRWPNGVARSASARLIGAAAIAAAVFRTLDGAQTLLIERRAAEAVKKALDPLPSVEMVRDVLMTVPTGLNLANTILVVTTLMAIAHYFRSERVQGFFLRLDGPEPEVDDE